MRFTPAFRRTAVAAITVLLAGCGGSSLMESKKIEYKSAGKLPPLEIPPDLASPTRDDRYAVPDVNPTGVATYSAYSTERSGRSPGAATSAMLPSVDKVRIQRSGTQRWLVVPESPEKVWPVVKDFWQELGFLIKIEQVETGVMETDWAENRAKIPQDAIRNILGRVMDGAYSTGERDKFRTRLERGTEPGTTEIYVSHRGVEEVYTSSAKDSTTWQPRPSDSELEAEFLRRMMMRFGVDEGQARRQIAGSPQTDRAKLQQGAGSGLLDLDEPFDRAWRRVGLALDRVGFTVEDRDRSKGYYFVRYVDPERDAMDTAKKNDGVLSKLMFWRSSKGEFKTEQYRVVVKDMKDTSQVLVLNKDGVDDKSETSRKILTLLQQQLK